MISKINVPPRPAGITLIVAVSFFPFREWELKHPLTIWLPFSHFYRCVQDGNGGLKSLIQTGDICQVFLWIPATEEKFQEYKAYLRSQGLTQIYRVAEDQLHRWVKSLPEDEPETKRRIVMQKGATRFPFQVLHGKQHNMEYLLVGFSEADLPDEIRLFPRLKFVTKSEVYAMGSVSSAVQVGILSAELDEDDMLYVKGQLVRARLPESNIRVEHDIKRWVSWFRHEFNIPVSGNGSLPKRPSLKLIVGCSADSLPEEVRNRADILLWSNTFEPDRDCSHLPADIDGIFVSNDVSRIDRHDLEMEAVRRGLRPVYFSQPHEICGLFQTASKTEPEVVVVGVNLSAIPEVLRNSLYCCYNDRDSEKLVELASTTKLLVVCDYGMNPDTVLRLKELARRIGAQAVHLAGGTGVFKKWMARTDVKREFGIGRDQSIPARRSRAETEQDVVQKAEPLAPAPVAQPVRAEDKAQTDQDLQQALERIRLLQMANLRLSMENKTLKAKLKKLEASQGTGE